MDLGLEGRVAIVTGASRGIGLAVVERLVAEGCEVVAVSRTAGDGPGHHVAADVTDPGAADRVVGECLERFGRLDVLVNNAGGAEPAALEQLTDADWQRAFEFNFFAAVRFAAACAPVMRERRWGRMVHVASVSGREPDRRFAPYSAAKAALLNFSTSLSHSDAPETPHPAGHALADSGHGALGPNSSHPRVESEAERCALDCRRLSLSRRHGALAMALAAGLRRSGGCRRPPRAWPR